MEIVRECADKYNSGSAFVTQEYLENRAPVFSLPTLECCIYRRIPIVFDISRQAMAEAGVAQGASVLLTYQDQALAVLEVDEAFSYDRELMAQHV